MSRIFAFILGCMEQLSCIFKEGNKIPIRLVAKSVNCNFKVYHYYLWSKEVVSSPKEYVTQKMGTVEEEKLYFHLG